jgi:CheY-like chemotaxis protein
MTDSTNPILVVDDYLPTCKLLVRLLTLAGFQAAYVQSGEAALDFVESGEPRVILLDLMMPGMDGFEVLRRIRTREGNNNVPIVVYSALSDSETQAKARRLGANDFVVKSTNDFEEIRLKIGKLI